MTTPMLRVRPDARLDAFEDTTYPSRAAASATFAFDAGETWPRPLSARETVAVETPASFATSSMPAMCSLSGSDRSRSMRSQATFDPTVRRGQVPDAASPACGEARCPSNRGDVDICGISGLATWGPACPPAVSKGTRVKLVKRLALGLVVVFALFYMITRPEDAATAVEGAVGAVFGATEAVGRFFSSLVT